MDHRDIENLYNTVNSFYIDRRLSLKYSTVNGYDVLQDNKVVFLGTLTADKTKPADRKALLLVQRRWCTIALRCEWKDAKLVKDSIIRVKVLEKPLWQLNIPECLTSVSVGNEEKEPFWELGEPVFYEGSLKNRRNEGEWISYHDYETKNIAKFEKFENGKKVSLVEEKDMHPKLREQIYVHIFLLFLYSKEYLKNGQPKFLFDLEKNTFKEFFDDGSLFKELKVLENGDFEMREYEENGKINYHIFESAGYKGNHGIYDLVYEDYNDEEKENMRKNKDSVPYQIQTYYLENGKVGRIFKQLGNGKSYHFEYYSEIEEQGKDSESEDKKILYCEEIQDPEINQGEGMVKNYEPDGFTLIEEEGKCYHENGKLSQRILEDEKGEKTILEYNSEGNLSHKIVGDLISYYSQDEQICQTYQEEDQVYRYFNKKGQEYAKVINKWDKPFEIEANYPNGTLHFEQIKFRKSKGSGLIVEYDEVGNKKINALHYNSGRVRIFFRNSWLNSNLGIRDVLLRFMDNSLDAEVEKKRFSRYLEEEGIEINPGVSIKGKDCYKKISELEMFEYPKAFLFWNLGFRRVLYPQLDEFCSGNTYQEAQEGFKKESKIKKIRNYQFNYEYSRANFANSIIEFELSQDEREVWFYRRRDFQEKVIVLKEDENGNLKNIVFS